MSRQLSHTIDEVYHRDQQIKALEQQLADVRYTINELKRLGADQQQRVERLHGVVGW
jgi:t-SNARE complex subunit (syntaxin)